MISVVATAVGGWGRYAKPMIDSILKHEPGAEIIIVDAGRLMPNEYRSAMIIKADKVNCSAGQNIGLGIGTGDWFLVCDVDVICKGSFLHLFDMEPGVYGPKMHSAGFEGMPRDWLDGWLYAIHRDVFDAVGGFDENIEGAGFEDADLCYRAENAGYPVARKSFPFHHLEAGIKSEISPGYRTVRENNIEYVKQKHSSNRN
jgi:hypothetical protein